MKQDNEKGNREWWEGDKLESFALYQEAGLQHMGLVLPKLIFQEKQKL